ncbi:MAG TPA: sulfatase-like hydrolase/transferase [Anaerolineales bacterium]|nr:sulfatase-like hydrolase/transferase [Anaerolineales bacterium]
MNGAIHRRDFLKLAGFLPLSLAAPRWVSGLSAPSTQQNVIVVVFDAFSAFDISLYGYQRDTTPNLRRLAKRAIVYHNHYAGSNFTTSGTASLLTGTLPWTHRALRPKDPVARPFVTQNLFSTFDDYFRLAYTHNGWANILLEQFESVMNEHVPWKSLFLGSYDAFVESLFQRDEDIASVSWTRNLNLHEDGYAYSLFFSHLYEILQAGSYKDLKRMFPRGLPSTGDVGAYFILERAIDWLGRRLMHVPQPFLGYFHLLPPHGPYNTELDFYNHFRGDSLKPPDKPADVFTEDVSDETLLRRRTEYDEFILYVDREFGRFYDSLEQAGLLQNTWLVFTSDHGEMFERGISAHSTNALYQPVIRIPLLVFEPGRQVGADVYTPTSAADILPTLAQVTGHPVPAWTEGTVLPPYASGAPDPNRHIYVVRAARNLEDQPLTTASTMLLRDRYKLLYFFGYPERGVQEMVKLYDLKTDPDELVDLSSTRKDVAASLLAELKARLNEVNKPYL